MRTGMQASPEQCGVRKDFEDDKKEIAMLAAERSESAMMAVDGESQNNRNLGLALIKGVKFDVDLLDCEDCELAKGK